MPDNLPAVPLSLQDVAEEFGEPVALKLMLLFGGLDIRAPKKATAEMIDMMGQEMAQRVCFFLSGQKIYVPTGRIERRKAEVARLQSQGYTQAQISQIMGISGRHVRRLSHAPVKSLPLFPDLEPQTGPLEK